MLIDVPLEVLRADVVVRPVDGPLELAPEALDGVRMDLAPDVLLRAVADGGVAVAVALEVDVGAKLVGHHLGPYLHVGADERHDGLVLDVRDRLGVDAALALGHAEYGGLALRATPARPMPLATDVGLVGLDSTAEHPALLLHELPDLVGDPPRGLIGYGKLTLKLLGADAILRGRHVPHGEEPLVEVRVGLLEDRPGLRADLVASAVADVMRCSFLTMVRAHTLAGRAFRLAEAGPEQILKARPVVREVLIELLD